jgi:hypothetical protein
VDLLAREEENGSWIMEYFRLGPTLSSARRKEHFWMFLAIFLFSELPPKRCFCIQEFTHFLSTVFWFFVCYAATQLALKITAGKHTSGVQYEGSPQNPDQIEQHVSCVCCFVLINQHLSGIITVPGILRDVFVCVALFY